MIEMNLINCKCCNGSGVEMVDIHMSSNPFHYGDYKEIWEDCHVCDGTGKAKWSVWIKRVPGFIWSKLLPSEEETVEEIPF